jgi:acetyl-CoA carboxylase biotin carboxyl carrier protein
MVNETDIVELSVNSKKFKLAVKKKEALEAAEPQVIHVQAPSAAAAAAPAPVAAPAPAAPAAPAAAPAPKPAAAPAAAAPVDGVEIASPMAGTFYRAPAPGEPAFINEGDRVTAGQTIGIIEAMKLMNEIEAEVSGTVVKITAENGKPVTPGQALVVIKP